MKRRNFLKVAGVSGAGIALMPTGFIQRKIQAAPAGVNLSDPALQPKFTNPVPDALSPGFHFQPDQQVAIK